MERTRQLVGEMLVYCFVMVVLTGGFLVLFHVPDSFYSLGGQSAVYSGSYAPLRGVMMSSAYASTLELTLEVRGSALLRQLHHESSILLILGTAVWILLGRLRYSLALLGLGLVLLGALSGYGSADDRPADTVLGGIPAPLWYGLHLLTALIMGATLALSPYRRAVRER
ncbi:MULTISPECIES: hypothetical protein [unclassified Nonomuraea]|uniref:hypothetical protein n=1 Tax=unclassified Nonomuraea TaxID=2593643 RepID=UPI0033C0F066